MSYLSVHLNAELKHFINNVVINIYQGTTTINLMKLFPLLNSGICIQETLDEFFTWYFLMSDLEDPNQPGCYKVDDLILKSFYESDKKPPFKVIKRSPADMILNEDEISLDILIQDHIRYFSPNELLYCDDILDNMRTETHLMSIIKIVKDLPSPTLKCLIEILNILIKSNTIVQWVHKGVRLFLDALITETWIQLLYAIIINDRDLVEECLSKASVNNYEAYRLALEVGNLDIIDIIETRIVRQYWINQQVLNKLFTELIGVSNISETLFGYSSDYIL